MGIRKKRKEVTALKRITALLIALIFTTCTVLTAPVSYADKHDKTKFKGRSEDKIIEKTVEGKDTSWFNYKKPKKEYSISTEAQLIGLASLVNEEQIDIWKPTRLESFEGVTFVLTRDIELTETWTPIGRDDSSNFAGVFDGNGHTISNVKITTSFGHSGFFGYLTGEVRNLNLVGENKSFDSNCGGVVGTLSSTAKVSNCTSNIKVTGNDKTGGIVGYNEGGTIERCVNLGEVSGTYKVGGVVGENWGGAVLESGNRGAVNSSRRGVGTYGTGGVAGRSVSAEAVVEECYNVGEITSNTEATGGVVGYINATGSTVTDSYNIGTINIKLKDSKKKLTDSVIGGVVGIAGVNGVKVRNCYNAGMANGADIAGGVIGEYLNETENEIDERYIRNNYYVSMSYRSGIGLVEDEGDKNIDKAAKGTSAGGAHNLTSSLSAAFMKDTGVYGNNGYPVLRWQQPISIVEKTTIDNMPEKIQKALDDYLIETADDVRYGEMMLKVFVPQSMTTNAFILYNEAKDKIDELKKEVN